MSKQPTTPRRGKSGSVAKTPASASRKSSVAASSFEEEAAEASPSTHHSVGPLMHAMLVGSKGPAPKPPTREKMEMSLFRAWISPSILILLPCFLTVFVPFTVYHCQSSLMKAFTEFSPAEIIALFPRPSWMGAGILFGWLLFQGLLLELLPGKTVYGPLTPAGEKPEYVDNGIPAWIITHGLYFVLGRPGLGLIPFGALYQYWGEFLVTANIISVVLCVFLYWKGRNYPSTADSVYTDKPIFDFFQGTELHPRVFGINVKQLLNCRFSMMGWSIVHLCFAETQYDNGDLSTGMLVCASLHVLYLLKFFWWEAGYFRSIDIILDRCGWYIVWGVVAWVPTCYLSAVFVLVDNPVHWPNWFAAIVFVVGMIALYVNYDADHQRMHFREMKGDVKIWGKTPEWIVAKYTTADGEKHTSLLLHSGYWGVSRHFHYIPEITLAGCWCLASMSHFLLGGFYFVFLTILLIDRSSRDDEKCSAKYGADWKAYCKKVPYKIVPGVY